MTRSGRFRRLVLRAFAPLALGLLVALGGASTASADDAEYGDDDVVITVTISELDPCVSGLPGCDEGGGVLGMTGLELATPLGAGVVLLAVGLAAFALARRRSTAPPG